MQETILLIEDSPDLAGEMRHELVAAGYQVETVSNCEQALALAGGVGEVCIILDGDIADGEGLCLCRQLRTAYPVAPLLVLSYCDTLSDRIEALDNGADDYLLKPFDYRELLARLRAISRRCASPVGQHLRVQDLHIDRMLRQVVRGTRKIKLSEREYTLLEALALHCGQVLTPEVIQNEIWDNASCSTGIIAVYINHLRKKIDRGHSIKLIHTICGQGYVMTSFDNEPAARVRELPVRTC